MPAAGGAEPVDARERPDALFGPWNRTELGPGALVQPDHLGLFDTPPTPQQVRLSLAVIGVLVAAFLFILPVRDVRLAEVVVFVPMANATILLGELITATLLYSQAAVFRSRALTVLASGYLYSALLFIPHTLSFPGALAPDGLLGGSNTTIWVATLQQAGFAVAVILYVRAKRRNLARQPGAAPPSAGIAVGLFSAIGLAATVAVLSACGHDLLPALFINRTDDIYWRFFVVEFLFSIPLVIAMVVLFRARSSVLDTWLLVALSGWTIESLLTMTLHARFTAGFYLLFVLILFSDLFVMVALIAEANRLYGRLALSTAAQSALARELLHRGNNLLTVVQALAQRSFADAADLADAQAKLELRLQALARANRLLARADGKGFKLCEIVTEAIEPFTQRAVVTGEDVWLNATQVQDLSLAIHELGTNAVKYGALSRADGVVSIEWRLETTAKPVVRLTWREQGGPPVVPPTHSGQGTRLLRSLFNDIQLRYDPGGLNCEIGLPVSP